MRLTVVSTVTNTVTLLIDRDDIKYSLKAVGLPVRRSSDKVYVERAWFPLSQVRVEDGKPYCTVIVPKWLYDKKISDGFEIS